jgi:mono/diheme cytochrome c family protein
MRLRVLLAVAVLAVPLGLVLRAEGTAQAPELLSQTGLYDASGAIAPGNLPFLPQYPLWSDGAAKARWIHLPQGKKIDVSDLDLWRFPEGTKLWKEFSFGGRKVETRMLWKSGGEWVFATYVWDADQSNARLAPAEGIADVVELAPGKHHSIPSLADCAACHRSSPATVLGFSALQLSDDRDPLAPHGGPLKADDLTLRSLLDAELLEPARAELAIHPPRVRESDPVARAAIGYLSGNCGGCHNGAGPLARLGLNLLHDVAAEPAAPEPARVTAVGVAGGFLVPGHSTEESRRVAPGAPDRSVLLYRMKSRRPSSQMPPLGTVVRDEEAVQLVSRWVERLK